MHIEELDLTVVSPQESKPRKKNKPDKWIPYLFILPSAIMIIAFLFYPIGTVFYYSLQNYDLSAPFYNGFAGLGNFKKVFTEDKEWKENGFQLVGDASDGETGLELIEKHKPQIVVSDIKMPFMDGLEMARIIKGKTPNIKFIFLTGYEDFQYAHEALEALKHS